MERELSKLQNKYKTEVTQVEREGEALQKRLEESEAKWLLNGTRVRNMEVDNDNFER